MYGPQDLRDVPTLREILKKRRAQEKEPIRVQLKHEPDRFAVAYLDNKEVGEILESPEHFTAHAYIDGMHARSCTDTYGEAILAAERLLGELMTMR